MLNTSDLRLAVVLIIKMDVIFEVWRVTLGLGKLVNHFMNGREELEFIASRYKAMIQFS